MRHREWERFSFAVLGNIELFPMDVTVARVYTVCRDYEAECDVSVETFMKDAMS